MIRDHLEEMAGELAEHRLEVAIIPAPDPRHAEHGVRVAIQHNPGWYRRLCERNAPGGSRKPAKNTRIRRANVERVLSRLIDGKPSRSFIAPYLLGEAERRAATERAA